jgi:integration host factor subunit beta
MTRSDLIAELHASNPHLRVVDIERIVEVVFEAITEALARGDKVELRGFAVFGIKQRKARIGRNPRNGVAVAVAAKPVAYFRASREMIGRLNGRAGKPGR